MIGSSLDLLNTDQQLFPVALIVHVVLRTIVVGSLEPLQC